MKILFRIMLMFLLLHPLVNHAQDWELVGFEGREIDSVIIDPNDSNTIYVGLALCGISICKTTDAGASWDTLLYGYSISDMEVHPTDPDIIYAAIGSYGIIKTSDGGQNWELRNTGIHFSPLERFVSIAINPHQPDILLAGSGSGAGGNGLYRTTNSGNYWVEVGQEILTNAYNTITFHPTGAQHVYVGSNEIHQGLCESTDGGDQWVEVPSFPRGPVKSICVDSHNPFIIYVGAEEYDGIATHPAFFKTVDNGQSWTETVFQEVNHVPIVDIVIYPENHEIIYITNKADVLKSTDGGETWSSIWDEAIDIWVESMAISNDCSYLYLATWYGLYRLELDEIAVENSDTINQFTTVTLDQCFPNPFSSQTAFQYTLPSFQNVNLTVFDGSGRLVKPLFTGYKTGGEYEITWDGTNVNNTPVASGVYFFHLKCEEFFLTQRVVLAR